jgi:hypothetical protein
VKRRIITLTVAMLFLVTPAASGQRQADLGQSREAIENGWRFDYQAAREEARNSNKPMMVVLRCVP